MVWVSNAGGGLLSPNPGRSTATQVNLPASCGMTLRHSYHDAGQPCPNRITGPRPPTT